MRLKTHNTIQPDLDDASITRDAEDQDTLDMSDTISDESFTGRGQHSDWVNHDSAHFSLLDTTFTCTNNDDDDPSSMFNDDNLERSPDTARYLSLPNLYLIRRDLSAGRHSKTEKGSRLEDIRWSPKSITKAQDHH